MALGNSEQSAVELARAWCGCAESETSSAILTLPLTCVTSAGVDLKRLFLELTDRQAAGRQGA